MLILKRSWTGAMARATDWIVANPRAIENNPSLMYMLSDMAKMSGDARLRDFVSGYDTYLSTVAPPKPVNAVWHRFVNADAHVPLLPSYDLRNEGLEVRWDAYAVAPDKVELSYEERSDMFSPTKYYWGARHHQLLAVEAIYPHQLAARHLDLDIKPFDLTLTAPRYATPITTFEQVDSASSGTAFILAAGFCWIGFAPPLGGADSR